jgi:hypothetical protein
MSSTINGDGSAPAGEDRDVIAGWLTDHGGRGLFDDYAGAFQATWLDWEVRLDRESSELVFERGDTPVASIDVSRVERVTLDGDRLVISLDNGDEVAITELLPVTGELGEAWPPES